MAIQAFGVKLREDTEAVYYKFGATPSEMIEEAKIQKDTFELSIEKDINGKMGTYLMCKLASKIVKFYKNKNKFSEKISSQS